MWVGVGGCGWVWVGVGGGCVVRLENGSIPNIAGSSLSDSDGELWHNFLGQETSTQLPLSTHEYMSTKSLTDWSRKGL